MNHDTDKKLRETLSRNLKDRIRKLGYTQAEIADATGISTSALSSYCGGARYPRPEQLNALANFLGCTAGELTDGNLWDQEDRLGLSNEAYRIASSFDQLDKHGRNLVRILLEAELNRVNDEKNRGGNWK